MVDFHLQMSGCGWSMCSPNLRTFNTIRIYNAQTSIFLHTSEIRISVCAFPDQEHFSALLILRMNDLRTRERHWFIEIKYIWHKVKNMHDIHSVHYTHSARETTNNEQIGDEEKQRNVSHRLMRFWQNEIWHDFVMWLKNKLNEKTNNNNQMAVSFIEM